jgi:hypothetical protein
LGDHLGLSSSAQAGTLPPAIAHNPQTQDGRQKFVGNHPDGATYFTHQNAEELKQYADPGGQLNDSYRNIAALEAGWRFAMSKGDVATAGRLAASVLHYNVLTSQNLSDQAAHALYNGDIKDAVDKTNEAIQAIPGATMHVELMPDGKTVQVTGSNLNGEALWRKYGSAATILEHATALGRTGKLQWDALESQAAKYDSTYAEMTKARNMNATQAGQERRQQEVWQHQQDVLDAKQAAKEKATSDAQAQEAAVLRGMAQPRLPGGGTTPAITPQVTPGVTPAPPPGATAGIPPAPTAQASFPSAQAEDVESGPPPPTRPDEVEGYEKSLPAQQNEEWKTYYARYKDWADQRNEMRKEARADRREAFSQTQQTARMREQEKLQAQREDTAASREADKQHLAAIAPMNERDLGSRFSTEANPDDPNAPTGKEPVKWLAATPAWADASQNKDFMSANTQGRLSDALVNTQRMNAHASTNQVADFVTGVASNKYTYQADEKPVTDDYGTRYHVVYIRPDGSRGSLLVPEEDMNNIIRSQQAMRTATQAKPTSALPPAPNAQPFPGVISSAAPPSGGFNRPAQPTSPRVQWWLNQALGRGQSPPPFGQPGQGTGGYP